MLYKILKPKTMKDHKFILRPSDIADTKKLLENMLYATVSNPRTWEVIEPDEVVSELAGLVELSRLAGLDTNIITGMDFYRDRVLKLSLLNPEFASSLFWSSEGESTAALCQLIKALPDKH